MQISEIFYTRARDSLLNYSDTNRIQFVNRLLNNQYNDDRFT